MSKGEREQNKKGKGGNKGAVIVTVVAVVVIIALIGVIVFLLQPQEEEEKRRNVVITPENIEEVLEQLEEEEMVSYGYYTSTMNTTWNFKNGTEASYNAVVENVEKNTNDVFFDIVLEENEEEVLYESPVIPRGSRLENIALDKVLEAGNYDCVVIYHLIDEDQNTLSTLRVALKIVIEE